MEGMLNNLNSESAGSEASQYKQYLDQKLEMVKAELQAQSGEHNTLQVFQEIQDTIEKSNEDALDIYNKSIEQAQLLNSERIRNKSMQSARKMYDTVLEANRKLLDDFVKDFNVPVKK